jgi:hypothetical protein
MVTFLEILVKKIKISSQPLALNHPQIWVYSNPQKKIEQVNHHHFGYNQPQTVGDGLGLL